MPVRLTTTPEAPLRSTSPCGCKGPRLKGDCVPCSRPVSDSRRSLLERDAPPHLLMATGELVAEQFCSDWDEFLWLGSTFITGEPWTDEASGWETSQASTAQFVDLQLLTEPGWLGALDEGAKYLASWPNPSVPTYVRR